MRSSAVPDPVRILSVSYFFLLVLALFRAALPTADPPLLLPYLASLLSAASLWILGSRPQRRRSFLRVGFHVGFFTFLLSVPLFSPEGLGSEVAPSVRWLTGLALLLSVVGFELGYWTMGSRGEPSGREEKGPLPLTRTRLLHLLVLLGMSGWAVTTIAVAQALGVPVMNILTNIRGRIDGATGQIGPVLRYVGILSGCLYFASASAASVLLTSTSRRNPATSVLCWATLLMTAALGFGSGSRGFFAFASMPLTATCWLRLSRSPRSRALRTPFAVFGIAAIVLVWGIMSAVRGADLRRYEGGWERFSPERHAEGALSIYAELEKVVEACPDRLPYLYGDSILPVLLGWVPRPLWPTKPYPFSAAFWCASTQKPLDEMGASIAYSLPGEGYGNFGLLGAILWCTVFGLICRLGDVRLDRYHPSHPLRLQLAAMGSVWVALIVRGGVAEMVYLGLFPFVFSWGVAAILIRSRQT